MKALVASMILAAASALALAAGPAASPAANPAAPPAAPAPAAAAAAPAGHPPTAMPSGHGAAGAADMSKVTTPLNKKGKVLTVLDAKQFTYMELQDGAKKLWLVSPTLAVKVGNTVSYTDAEMSPKYHSKILNRDFTNLVMTSRAVVDK